jgi:hypothetical protein
MSSYLKSFLSERVLFAATTPGAPLRAATGGCVGPSRGTAAEVAVFEGGRGARKRLVMSWRGGRLLALTPPAPGRFILWLLTATACCGGAFSLSLVLLQARITIWCELVPRRCCGLVEQGVEGTGWDWREVALVFVKRALGGSGRSRFQAGVEIFELWKELVGGER